MTKPLTADTLDAILYALTYENGVTFGICGNASAEMKDSLRRALDCAYGLVEGRDATPNR